MNCNRRRNVLRDLPSYEASKGERIVKALQRLWEKLQHIEQVRLSENQSKSSTRLDILDKEDLTLNDVKYKLGMLQVQYVRSIVQKKLQGSPETADKAKKVLLESKSKSDKDVHSQESIAQTTIDEKETQTGNSLIFMDPQSSEWSSQVATPDHSKDRMGAHQKEAEKPNFSLPQQKPSSQPHYHLKLDDVPFILGASSTASHSVVANVQNIIAMMKSHNRVLCGSKPHQSSSSHSLSKNTSTLDTNKMVKKLCKELSELSARQEKLKKRFDDADKDSFYPKGSSAQVETNPSDDNESLKKGQKRTSQHKLAVPSARMPPLPARNKLMRSLRDFKTHLSEEDITWN